MTGWFRDTPESLRMLEEERLKLAAAEAKYECRRCGKVLEPDYALSDTLNRVRAWMWRHAHKMNCRPWIATRPGRLAMTRCLQCEKPPPRYACWMGKPEDESLPFHQPGAGPCPLGMPARWEPENPRGF